jgi:hypothetical protein
MQSLEPGQDLRQAMIDLLNQAIVERNPRAMRIMVELVEEDW